MIVQRKKPMCKNLIRLQNFISTHNILTIVLLNFYQHIYLTVFPCRIVEMNGRTVISLPEQEIFKMLNEWSKPELSLLVIRSNEPITSSVSEEELRSVKEDLSLALLELESVQQENVDLSNHIKK